MGNRLRRAILGLILAAFVLLALGFNLATPLYEGFDESEHVAYVTFVRETGEIPVLPHRIFEALQPPAYYFLQAGVAAVLGLDAPPELASAPDAGAAGRFFVHPVSEREHPFGGGAGTVRLLRVVSTLIGVGTLVLVFATSTRIFPGRPDLSLSITAVTAFVPQFVSIHALVNNDSLAIFFGVAILYASVRIATAEDRRTLLRMAALAGIAVGLGLLTKGYALAALPLPFLALAWGRVERRTAVAGAAIALGAILLISGWLLGRNLVLYGEPWPDRVAQEHIRAQLPASVVARSIDDPLFRDIFLREVRDSFWYRGGFGQVAGPAWMYLALDLLLGAVIVGSIGTLFAPSRLGLTEAQLRCLRLFAVAIGLQLAGIVYYNLSIQQFQGRWLFASQPAIATFMVLGTATLVPERLRRPTVAALPAALLILTLSVLLWVTVPAFAGTG